MLPLTSEHKLFVFLCHAKNIEMSLNRKFPHPFLHKVKCNATALRMKERFRRNVSGNYSSNKQKMS